MCIRDRVCKAQIEKARTEILSNIGQLHEHVDMRFTTQQNAITEYQDRIKANTLLINQQKSELEHKIDEKFYQVKRDVAGRVNPTACFYRHNEDPNNQPKFWGDANTIQFIRDCERGMDSVGDQYNDTERIEWVTRKRSGAAALWYSIVRNNL